MIKNYNDYINDIDDGTNFYFFLCSNAEREDLTIYATNKYGAIE